MTEIAKELAKISEAYTAFCIAHSEATPKGCACDSCLFRYLPCLAAADSDEVSEYDWRNALEILKEFEESEMKDDLIRHRDASAHPSAVPTNVHFLPFGVSSEELRNFILDTCTSYMTCDECPLSELPLCWARFSFHRLETAQKLFIEWKKEQEQEHSERSEG